MTSILVRKHCQPVLDEAGYSMFFATVEDRRYGPGLVIYTTCGKPFVHIHGVQFSQRRPTIAECEYSAVLLEQWMGRHKKDFDAYVDAYTEYYTAESPKDSIKVGDAKYSTNGAGFVDIQRNHTYTDKDGKEHTYYTLHTLAEEGIASVSWSRGTIPFSELGYHTKLPAKYKAEAVKFLDSHKEHRALARILNKARETVTTCTI